MKLALLLLALAAPFAAAGPFSGGKGDAGNAFDAPVPGFTGPAGDGNAPVGSGAVAHAANRVNPLFFGWADQVQSYDRAGMGGTYALPERALGAVTGDEFDVVALGDGSPPGSLTLRLAGPVRNLPGADFAVFENALSSGASGQVFGELLYVEVSSDGVTFARFPSISLTPKPATTFWAFGTFAASDVFNLAGKHVNANGESWGTPFDLTYLAAEPQVTSGQVNLQAIAYVRLVDVPGDGGYFDRANELGYADSHPIYDPWPTSSFGSAGADIEAVGVISRWLDFAAWLDLRGFTGPDRAETADPEGNGLPNLLDYAFVTFGKQGAPVRATLDEGRAGIEFVRDERALDLIYEVRVSSDLVQWTTIARSSGGQPTVGVDGHEPGITETSGSAAASVGVLHRVRVSEELAENAPRFFRVEIQRIAP